MKREHDIDPVDRKILAILQRDAAISHADLAERVGASAASCWRRVKAMEAAGILVATVWLADADLLRCGVNVLCNVRILNQHGSTPGSFEAFVMERPEIVECYSMSGDWDYLLRIVAADVADYNSFLSDMLLKHPSVRSASSHFALEKIKFTTALPV